MAKRVSLKDIAEKVGVSTALVSYVLNGLEKEKRVGPEVVKKIQAAAKELRYKPNQIARSLRKGSTSTIGLIVADISNPFFGQLARIIEDEAAKLGYTVIFGSSDEDCSKSEALIETLLNRQVDGIILAPSEGCNEQVKLLLESGLPVVLIDRYFPEISASCVVLDNFTATYNAAKFLISKGYKKTKMIAYNSALIHMKERVRGFSEAMNDSNLAIEAVVKKVRFNHMHTDLEKIMDELLSKKETDALLFATNALSISGLYSIRKYNLKVPEEMAIIGFDGHEVFDFFPAPLTYIQQPLEEMGKESVKILIEQIKGSKKTVHVELKHQLIARASC